MAQIEFVDCVLKELSRTPKGGGVASFQAAYRKSIARTMNWVDTDSNEAMEPAKFQHGMGLDGDLAATVITMQSGADTKLKKFQFTVKAQRLHKFALVRREEKGKRGKGYRWELTFVVLFPDLEGCAALEEYMVNTGEAEGGLIVEYNPKAEQKTLPGTEPEDGKDSNEKQVAEIIERSKKKNAASAAN